MSTAQEVTATSGRGIGMDAVKKALEELDGHVEVQSIPEQGTQVILTFPARLGSSAVLFVRTVEHELGIPMLSVQGIVAAGASNLRVANGETRFAYHDELFPVKDLGVVLGLRQPRALTGGQLVLLNSQGQRVALAVDEVVGDMDLVILPLPREVAHIPIYQGAAILARGEVALIVRPDWFVGAQVHLPTGTSHRNALVVDDSLTARALHRAMLEVGGYTVHGTSGPEQALEQLRYARYDVIVCDLAMGPMDGIQFVSLLRTRPDTSDVPIIVVSAREGEAAREQALAAGADAFVSKAHCASGGLLTELAKVVRRRKGAA
jgi:CheY-like chemotaxis protein